MEISLRNLYVDIGALRVNTLENYTEQQVQQGNKKLE